MNSAIKTNKKNYKIDLMNLLVFVGLYIFLIVYSGFWSNLDCMLHDFWLRTRFGLNNTEEKSNLAKSLFPVKPINEDIVLIIIDDKSMLGVQGLFNGDRTVYAQALKNLAAMNPKTVGLDVFFANTSEETAYQDKLLAKAVTDLKDKIVLKAYRRDDRRMTLPFPELIRYAQAQPSYFKNYGDKAIRSVSLVFRSEAGKVTPSFQTSLWTKFKDIPLNKIHFKDGYLINDETNLAKLVDSEYMLINYNKNLQRYRRFSFYDLYNDNIPASLIENKLVIIGSANSMTEEKLFTPINGDQYSPFLNAIVLDNLIEKTYLTPNTLTNTAILTFIVLLILFFVFAYTNPVISLVITIVTIFGLLYYSLYSLTLNNSVINVCCPIFAALITFIFTTGKKYYYEHNEKRQIKNAFQHYVTASVVNEILKNPEKLNLHGEERNLTIFFSDIEGFTTLSEGMSPLDVVSLLNEYLTAMTDIIFDYNGLLDKYEGDAIMAVFGAPVNHADHAIRACRCAIKNQRVLSKLREKWQSEGKPQIKVRIGINTGDVVVGNMGSTMRFDYTVIGDNVNLASRLETANKVFNTSILISEATAELAKDAIVSRKLAKMKIVGKSILVNVYEPLADLEEDDEATIEAAKKSKLAYEQAEYLICNRDFEGAQKILNSYLENNQDDKAAQLLLKKAEGFILVPPPADWEFIVTQEVK